MPDIASLLAGGFTEETARSLYAQGEEIAIFVMMQLVALAIKTTQVSGVHPNGTCPNCVHPNDIHPSQPSGSVAVFLKEPRKKRRKKPGAKSGHKGSHRPPPENITRRVTHVATCCPDCGGKLNRRRGTTRKRYTEDIPDEIKPEITEHTIQQDYCPKCRKVVEPVASVHQLEDVIEYLKDEVYLLKQQRAAFHAKEGSLPLQYAVKKLRDQYMIKDHTNDCFLGPLTD